MHATEAEIRLVDEAARLEAAHRHRLFGHEQRGEGRLGGAGVDHDRQRLEDRLLPLLARAQGPFGRQLLGMDAGVLLDQGP
ncbi:MAG: hypothetical protein WDN45_03295 [Caulobacteraceae bacterium]